jgi:VWFA-related protein
MNAKSIAATALLTAVLILSASAIAQQSQQPPDASTKIQVAVNSVIIPVVVRDAKGLAVGTLKKEDFQVFDNNKEQGISGFSVQERAVANRTQSTAEIAAVHPETHPQSTQPTAAPKRYIVFLFDDLHLEPGDLLQAQKVATKMIGSSLSDSDLALVLSFSGANSGFTHDHAKLLDAIANLKVQNLYRHAGRECPDVTYYQGSLIVNQHNAPAFQVATQDAHWCAHLDPSQVSVAEGMATQAARRAVAMGDQDVHVTLDFMSSVVRKMGTLQGERTIILVSPGFLTVSPETIAEESQVLDAAAESKVTISALDVRGLYTTDLDASARGANTALDLASADVLQNHSDAMSLNEDVMSSLADGTGGTYFHNSNDLEGGFQRLAAVPEYVYMLEIPLEKVKLDGSYHRLHVKVNQSGVNLQARRGYFAPKKEKK